jgi:hypothetical protein
MPTADRRGMTTSAAARINEFGAEATPGEAPVAQVKQFIDAGLRSGPNVMRWDLPTRGGTFSESQCRAMAGPAL